MGKNREMTLKEPVVCGCFHGPESEGSEKESRTIFYNNKNAAVRGRAMP